MEIAAMSDAGRGGSPVKKICPVLIIQGGAGSGYRSETRKKIVRKKLKGILIQVYPVLVRRNAVEAVTEAVRLMEDDPLFNAGYGSQLQADGRARLSAAVMEGSSQRFASVINAEGIRNPVLLARELLSRRSRVLDGFGAARLARELGLEFRKNLHASSLKRWRQRKEDACDTVGACALDSSGSLAAATSTGGRGFEYPGRVSDSGMPVANYASPVCAVSATGTGEEIMDEGLAVRIAVRVEDRISLRRSFSKTFREVVRRGKKMAAIGLDAKGNIAWAKSTESLAYAWCKGNQIGIF